MGVQEWAFICMYQWIHGKRERERERQRERQRYRFFPLGWHIFWQSIVELHMNVCIIHRWPGQDPSPLAPLFPEHSRAHFRRRLGTSYTLFYCEKWPACDMRMCLFTFLSFTLAYTSYSSRCSHGKNVSVYGHIWIIAYIRVLKSMLISQHVTNTLVTCIRNLQSLYVVYDVCTPWLRPDRMLLMPAVSFAAC